MTAAAATGQWVSAMPSGTYRKALQLGAKLGHLTLLELLQRHCNGNPGGRTVGVERLGEQLDVSESTVSRWLTHCDGAIFKALGFSVDRAPRAAGGRGRYNRYTSPQTGGKGAIFLGPEVYGGEAWREATSAQRGAYLALREQLQVPHRCGKCGESWTVDDDGELVARCAACGSDRRVRPWIETSYGALARRWGYADWRHVRDLVRFWTESKYFELDRRRSTGGGHLGIKLRLVDREALAPAPPPVPRARPLRRAIATVQDLGAKIAAGLGIDLVAWLRRASVGQLQDLVGECRDALGRAGRLTLRTALRVRRVILAQDKAGRRERHKAAVAADEQAHAVQWSRRPQTLPEAAAVARVRSHRDREARAAWDRLEALSTTLRALGHPEALQGSVEARRAYLALPEADQDPAVYDWWRLGTVLKEAKRELDLLRWRIDEPAGHDDLVGEVVPGLCGRIEAMVALAMAGGGGLNPGPLLPAELVEGS